jgi:hypothetical protein
MRLVKVPAGFPSGYYVREALFSKVAIERKCVVNPQAAHDLETDAVDKAQMTP